MKAFLGLMAVLLIGFAFQMGGVAETKSEATLNDTELGIDEVENSSSMIDKYHTKPTLEGSQTAVNSASLLAYENGWFPGKTVGSMIQLGVMAYGLFKAHAAVKGVRGR